MKLKKTTSTTKTHTFLVQVKMSAMDGKKGETEANNNNNNKSVVLETNLDEASTASDSAGGTRRNY